MSDLLDMSCIPVCKQLFPLLEERTAELKMVSIHDITWSNLSLDRKPSMGRITMQSSDCVMIYSGSYHDVLKLPSLVKHFTLFSVEYSTLSGRINVFLSRFMPLNDKSALNIVGHYNTANVTKYETVSEETKKG